jgi:hypothetical protein
MSTEEASNRTDPIEMAVASMREALGPCPECTTKDDRITELEAELERTRQAWVDEEDPRCEDVCLVACKGACGLFPGDKLQLPHLP